jgi:hypothetical protein
MTRFNALMAGLVLTLILAGLSAQATATEAPPAAVADGSRNSTSSQGEGK